MPIPGTHGRKAQSNAQYQRMTGVTLQRLIVSAMLAVAVLAVYAPVARYDFIALDDAQYVRDNENINHGFTWPGVKWVFENIVAGNWHPVTMLSHMADCQIYGLSPGGQHLTNVLLHTANTVLLFWLLLAMTERRNAAGTTALEAAGRKAGNSKPGTQSPSNLLPCALAAALFGLHPLHVESVAWISERKDVLSGFFCAADVVVLSAVRHEFRVGRQSIRNLVYSRPGDVLVGPNVQIHVGHVALCDVAFGFLAAATLCRTWRCHRFNVSALKH